MNDLPPPTLPLPNERFVVHLDELEKCYLNSVYDGRELLWEGTGHLEYQYLLSFRGRCAIANGCFDGCHPGHLKIFGILDTEAYARRLRPIVAMNSDKAIKRLKGRKPFMPQDARALLINNLKWPLTVVIFDEDTPQRLMDLLRPQVVIKGGEYDPRTVVRWKGSEVLSVPMMDGWSTSRLLGDTR